MAYTGCMQQIVCLIPKKISILFNQCQSCSTSIMKQKHELTFNSIQLASYMRNLYNHILVKSTNQFYNNIISFNSKYYLYREHSNNCFLYYIDNNMSFNGLLYTVTVNTTVYVDVNKYKTIYCVLCIILIALKC